MAGIASKGSGNVVGDVVHESWSATDVVMASLPASLRVALRRSSCNWPVQDFVKHCNDYRLTERMAVAWICYMDADAAEREGRGHLHTFCEVSRRRVGRVHGQSMVRWSRSNGIITDLDLMAWQLLHGRYPVTV